MAVREAEPDGHGAGISGGSEDAAGPPAGAVVSPVLDLLPREHRVIPRRPGVLCELDDERRGRDLSKLDQMAGLHAAGVDVL